MIRRLIILLLIVGCGTEPDEGCVGIEDIDKNCYATIQIGNQLWMAEIFTVQRELGHKSTDMTQKYLRFPEQRRLDDFPSLKDYIENRQNIGKNTIRGTEIRGTVYSNIPKLSDFISS